MIGEPNEGLLDASASPDKHVSDDAKSMAIMNLQAILDIEDLDKVIGLLEQNNWDEGQAANAYYAQQMSGSMNAPGGGDDQVNPFNTGEEAKDGEGYRAPIQQQTDQLIEDNPFAGLFAPRQQQDGGGGDPFARRQPQLPRRREIKPTDYAITIDAPYDDGEIDAATYQRQMDIAQRIYQRQTWGEYLYSWVTWGVGPFRWFVTLGGTIATSGYEQEDFDCGDGIKNDDRLLASLGQDKDLLFFKTCERSRKDKKPFLLVLVANPDDTRQVDIVIQSLAECDPMTHSMIKNQFNLMVVSQEQLDICLNDAHHYFRLSPQDDVNVFVLFIKAQFNISIMNRILQRDLVNGESLAGIIQEYRSLFDIMAEEDPGYRQLQILQDAGLIPVAAPQGQASNISPEMMDRIRAEDEQIAQQQRESMQQQQPNDIIQPRGARQSHVEPAQPIPEPVQEVIKPQVVRRVVNLPDEPTSDNTDSLELIFRMPQSGERLRRRFLKNDSVQIMYDYVDDLQNKETCIIEGADGFTDKYNIMQARPKVIYSDKTQTLEQVGFYPRGAVLQIQQMDEESD